MSNLDTTQDGPAIQKSIKSIINNPPSKNASATYASWLLLYVQSPLRNAFSTGPAKPSVLKVQATADGELEELFEDFNDGRVQFALAKVKDSNTQLGKNVFFAWCGEGVPEHVKGNYTSYLNTVARLFEGYHVQINARTTDDLNAEAIMQKVGKASGSNYSAATNASNTDSSSKPPPPVASKPGWKPGQTYTPTKSFGSSNPAPSRGRAQGATPVGNVDEDGWGEDAPQVSKSQMENVASAYKPTKVNIKELMSQPTSTTDGSKKSTFEKPDIVRGAYQPVGKVDINEIRAQGDKRFDTKPEPVKGAYQPIGKVNIKEIQARSQPESFNKAYTPPPPKEQSASDDEPKSLTDRAAAFSQSSTTSSSSFGRLQSLPKPKTAKAFGSGTFTGTNPPTPGGYGAVQPSVASTAPIGTANKDFASQGGKTPAQLWQEKKARERGLSDASEPAPVRAASPGITAEIPGAFSPNITGTSNTDTPDSPQAGGVSALRDRFKGMPMPSESNQGYSHQRDSSPPPAPMASKPVSQPQYDDHEEDEDVVPQSNQRSVPPPPQIQHRSPSPSPPGSPVRIVMPVARGAARSPSPEIERPKTPSPELKPIQPMAAAIGAGAIGAGIGAAASSHHGAVELTGRQATVLYDYSKAEDNELELVEGEIIGMIEIADEDWWEGTNTKGETGLFPSNYVEPIMGPEDEDEQQEPTTHHQQHEEGEEDQHDAAPPPQPARPGQESSGGQTAVASYEYTAVEENELSFPEGATITDIEFPDEDWWSGKYNGQEGLFPANYVELNQ